MAENVRIQIRCDEGTKREWDRVRVMMGLTHGEFARECARFVESNEAAFRRQLSSEERDAVGETREEG